MATSKPPVVHYDPIHVVHSQKVSATAPFQWLAHGLQTYLKIPVQATIFGLIFASIGLAITNAAIQTPQFVFAFWSGFLLVGPMFATVLYRMAKRVEAGSAPSMQSCSRLLFNNIKMTLIFSVLLAVVMIAWIRISGIVVALYSSEVLSSTSFVGTLQSLSSAMATEGGRGFVFTLLGVGGVFALIMFALSAWSLPMIVDDRTDIATAVVSSVKAVMERLGTTLIWGGIVAALTIVGMATYFVAFIVIFPILGFATWHGYKEMFK